MPLKPCCQCGNEVDVPEEAEQILQGIIGPEVPEEQRGGFLCMGCLALHLATHRVENPPDVPVRPSKYQFTADMAEISGFGGGYEQTCRNMVTAGLDWWDAHPEADPEYHGYKEVFGVLTEDNADAKALSEAVVAAANHDCTGAMHQGSIAHVFAARRFGWETYCAEMRRRKRAEEVEHGPGQGAA